MEIEKALIIFLKVETIALNDAIILFNIANIYINQGNIEKAKQYYNNTIQNCNKQVVQQAKELLKEL